MAGLGVGALTVGLLRAGLALGTIYRLAALPPALAAVLALRATARLTDGSRRPKTAPVG